MPAKYPPDPPEWSPVVTIEQNGVRSAICRDPDGSLWLVHDLDSIGNEAWDEDGAPDDDEDWDPRDEIGERLTSCEIAGLHLTVNGIAAIGGRLPPGASTVDAREHDGTVLAHEIGNGTWIARPVERRGVRPVPEPVVMFRDPHGELVPLPPPEGVALEPLDAASPCPACKSSSWQVAVVPDDIDEDSPLSVLWLPGERLALCQTCGHRESLGITQEAPFEQVVVYETQLSPEERQVQAGARLATMWRDATIGLGRPPVGLAPSSWVGPRRVGGYSGGWPDGEPITGVVLEHGDPNRVLEGPFVSVQLDRPGPLSELMTLDEWLETNLAWWLKRDAAPDPGDAEDAAELEETLEDKRTDAAVRRLPRQLHSIPLDASSVTFTAIARGETWIAFGDHEGIAITLRGKAFAIEDIQLATASASGYPWQ